MENRKEKQGIHYNIDGVEFDMFTKDYIRRNSVKQITESVAFDNLNTANRGGLMDPALGVSAYDKTSPCITCGYDTNNCYGHFGHIELAVNVYNPLMMKLIHKLLKAKCFNCHKLKLKEKQKLYLYLKFLLIKLGYLKEASELSSIVMNTLPFRANVYDKRIFDLLKSRNPKEKVNYEYTATDEYTGTEPGTYEAYENTIENTNEEDINTLDDEIDEEEKGVKSKKSKKKGQSSSNPEKEAMKKEKEALLEDYGISLKKDKLKRLERIIKNLNTKFTETPISLDIQIKLKEVNKEFWKEVNQLKCPHCDYKSQGIKKQGFLKFFLMPQGKKEKKRMEKLGLKSSDKKKENSKKQIEEDSDSDDDDIEQVDEEMKFLNPIEIKDHINKLWETENEILDIVFGNVFPNKDTVYEIKSTGAEIFFIENLIVTPNRFRPESRGMGDSAFLHQHTTIYTKILNISNQISQIVKNINNPYSDNPSSVISKVEKPALVSNDKNKKNSIELTTKEKLEKLDKEQKELKEKSSRDIFSKWIELQDGVNHLFDSSKASKKTDQETNGIRQLLEKKEGIFRMKMMGKRVNHAGRSVISPDPFIGANEVGVPLCIATVLTFPEIVADYNIEYLRGLVIKGATEWPGANLIEYANGEKVALSNVKEPYRNKHAAKLAVGDVVSRHLKTGDALLVNRQPTLHRPSIMAHKARVLPGEKTIRLHYSNCNSYNADFDGDEMNIHLLQNHIAREEAYSIANNENNYIVPTSGKPIRGLIQDSVVSGVFITMKDTFFDRESYYQLVYAALDALLTTRSISRIELQTPAIFKPKFLWTGKQVITTILKSLITKPDLDKKFKGEKGLNMDQKCKLAGDMWGKPNILEGVVVVRDNELLTGILDKNQVGNSEFGLIHSYYEIYGPELAGDLLSTFGRLFIHYLQIHHGFTCGIDDLLLKDEDNLKRRREIECILTEGMTKLANFFGIEKFKLAFDNFSNRNVHRTDKPDNEISNYKLLPEERKEIETLINLQNFKITDSIFETKKSTDQGLTDDEKKRVRNKEQISVLRDMYHESILKEDSEAIDANIDTVVKNAINRPSSQYMDNWLKKGLIKKFPINFFSLMVLSGAKGSLVNHTQISCMLGQQELEGKRVPRMASGKTLPSFRSFDPNPRSGGFVADIFSTGIRPQEFFFHCMAGREGLIDTAVKTSRSGYLQRCLIKHLEQLVVNYDYTVRDNDGNVIQFMYGEDSLDVTKTKYIDNFKFIQQNQDTYYKKLKATQLVKMLDTKSVKNSLKSNNPDRDILLNQFPPWLYAGSVSENLLSNMMSFIKNDEQKKFANDKEEVTAFKLAVYLKYFNSLITPGENVGILASQSVGEPSTQMTLNTFHLAGHGGANMTLGIPRLREILMTSENNIKTPFMFLPIKIYNKDVVEKLARKFTKYNLIELIQNIEITRKIQMDQQNNVRNRIYKISLKLEDLEAIKAYFETDENYVDNKIREHFIPKLTKQIQRHRRSNRSRNDLKISFKEREGHSKNHEATEDNQEGTNDEDEGTYENKSHKKKEKSEDNSDDESKKEEDDDLVVDLDNTNEDEIDIDADNMEIDDGEDIEEESEANVVHSTAKKPVKKEKEKKINSYRYEDLYITEMNLNSSTSVFSFNLIIPFEQKNILLKNILDKELKNTIFTCVKGINKTFITEKKNKKTGNQEFILQLEGSNYEDIYKHQDLIDINRIDTNDISFFMKIYGIEACRAAIVKEISAVFDAYSISVDKRHLGIIADYITYQGYYRSFNRVGMEVASSPFLKMSFETSMNYMINSCTTKDYDNAKNSSSRVVLGLLPYVGTGCFSLLQKVA